MSDEIQHPTDQIQAYSSEVVSAIEFVLARLRSNGMEQSTELALKVVEVAAYQIRTEVINADSKRTKEQELKVKGLSYCG